MSLLPGFLPTACYQWVPWEQGGDPIDFYRRWIELNKPTKQEQLDGLSEVLLTDTFYLYIKYEETGSNICLVVKSGQRLHHAAHMVLSCNIFNDGRRKSRRISILQASSAISLTLIYFVLLDFVSKMLACCLQSMICN